MFQNSVVPHKSLVIAREVKQSHPLTTRLLHFARNDNVKSWKHYTKGFTLIEVLIAMFIMLIGMLALLNTAAVIIENNLVNILRDEATYVAQSTMSDIRNTPFNSITSQPTVIVPRYFRGTETDYSVTVTVNALGTAGATKSIQVLVTWTYKGATYQNSILTVVNNS